MSTIISAGALGFGLGPVVGGAITEYLGWNWLFAVTGLSFLIAPLLLRLLPKESRKKLLFDLPGALLIGLGTTGLLLFLTLHSVFALVLGVIALTAFSFRIRNAESPFVQPSLFRNSRFMLLNGMGFTAYITNFATLFIIPLILIRLFGKSSVETGLIVFPGAMLPAISSNRIGKLIDKYGNTVIINWGISFVDGHRSIVCAVWAYFAFCNYGIL